MTIASMLKRWGPLALGVALVVVGLVLASGPATYGWFGSPDGTFVKFPAALVLLPTSAALALAAGIIVVTGWAGYLLGRRSRRGDHDA